ncbi:MAG: CHASE domain-containing protein [Xenococcaceae cyanobacterium MO_188.B29]|nr:CHASE domain-containing protein [Xenococcaceae cyanobacterium MO_188.B29]
MKQWQEKLAVISRDRKAFPYGVIATGIVCSFIAFAIVLDLEKKKIAQEFKQDSADIAASIERSIEKNLQNLESIVSFYNASEKVSRQEFQKFTQNYLETNPEIQALEWIPRVANQERKAYEQAARENGWTQFKITEQNDRQQLIRAKSRPEYFPVYFVEPYQGNEAALGFDIASNPTRLQALQLARDKGKAIATAPITLVQKNDLPQKGLLIFSPIYAQNTTIDSIAGRRENLTGFVLGVFNIVDLVESSLHYLQPKGIELFLFHDSDCLLYHNLSSTSTRTKNVNSLADLTSNQGLYHSFTFNFAGQKWLILTRPNSQYIWYHHTWHPCVVLGSGFLLTFVLTAYIKKHISLAAALQDNKTKLEERVQRKTEELQLAEARYQNIVENLDEGIFQSTTEGIYLTANKALASIYGYSSPTHLIDNVNHFDPQLYVDAGKSQELKEILARDGIAIDFEAQIYGTDGSTVWISQNIRIICNRRNRNSYYLGTVTDISDRKQAAEALQKSEERYRLIVETADEGIWLLDGNGNTQFVNPRVIQILGYERQEFFQRSLFTFVKREHQNILAKKLANLAPEQVEHYDCQLCCRDGSQLWISISASTVFNQSEIFKFNGILLMITNISDRKQAEIELAAAKYRAEAASEAKSKFIASMSHELRTPLNGILGSVKLLQRDLAQIDITTLNTFAYFQKNLTTIEKSGKHLLGVIDDILDFSQLDCRQLTLYPTPIYLPSFFREILTIIRAKAAKKRLQFTSEILDDLPPGIEADSKRLKQTLLHLLDNAVKFTNSGQIKFRVSTATNSELANTSRKSSIKICFEVIDTGIGIAPEKLNQIFQPFEQANQSKSWLEGTGLGLAVSQQLIELMGSQLQVTSQLGVGTTFWFEVSFPLAKIARSTKIQHQNLIVGYQGKQRRLLIADDKTENQFALISILKPLGFATLTANNGQEAVTLAQKIKPDLILIDLVMPFKSGFEAIQEIRQIKEFKDIPIIALSSSILDSSDFNHQIAGSDAFLTKPVQEQQLLALLKRYLQLEWVYPLITMDDYKTLNKSDEKITVSKIIVPPSQDLEDLHELAMLGSMKKICEWAISLEKLDPKYKPFASELQQLAKSFQEKEIVNLVKQHLTQE